MRCARPGSSAITTPSLVSVPRSGSRRPLIAERISVLVVMTRLRCAPRQVDDQRHVVPSARGARSDMRPPFRPDRAATDASTRLRLARPLFRRNWGRHQRADHGGVSRHLPWGSLPLGEVDAVIVASVCLTDAFRSRSFSLPQRLHPTVISWRSFTPLPPTGFSTFRAFPAGPAVPPLDGHCSPVVRWRPGSRATSELFSNPASVTVGEAVRPRRQPLLSWSFPSSRSAEPLRRAWALPSYALPRFAPLGVGVLRLKVSGATAWA